MKEDKERLEQLEKKNESNTFQRKLSTPIPDDQYIFQMEELIEADNQNKKLMKENEEMKQQK